MAVDGEEEATAGCSTSQVVQGGFASASHRDGSEESYGTATDSNIFDADRSASKIYLLDEGAVEATADNNRSTYERAGDFHA